MNLEKLGDILIRSVKFFPSRTELDKKTEPWTDGIKTVVLFRLK